jgi:hypothetical protein
VGFIAVSVRTQVEYLALQMKALRSFETSVTVYQSTRCNNPEFLIVSFAFTCFLRPVLIWTQDIFCVCMRFAFLTSVNIEQPVAQYSPLSEQLEIEQEVPVKLW